VHLGRAYGADDDELVRKARFSMAAVKEGLLK